MSRFRRYNLPPPVNAEYIVGELFEFLPEHDRVKYPPADTVELIPGGPAAEIWELRPEHDLVKQAHDSKAILQRTVEGSSDIPQAVNAVDGPKTTKLKNVMLAVCSGRVALKDALKYVAATTGGAHREVLGVCQRVVLELQKQLNEYTEEFQKQLKEFDSPD